MSIYIPYFYIIRHIESGKMYAGSRYAKGCHPEELLKEDGYQTSSDPIKKIISTEGLESFEILRIDMYCDNLHPYNYETLFLETNNCAESDNWFNFHNNHLNSIFGTEKHKFLMEEKYGEDNAMKVHSIKEKAISTNLEKYGVKFPLESKIIRDKSKETCMEKYGYEYIAQTEFHKNLVKISFIKKIRRGS